MARMQWQAGALAVLVAVPLAAAASCERPPCCEPPADAAPPATDAGSEPFDSGTDAAPVPTSPCPGPLSVCNEAEARGLVGEGPRYGRGVSWVDVDGDGWEDIWQADTGTAYSFYPRVSTLYRNGGDGTFAPMDLGIAPTDMMASWMGAWNDYDEDGDPDVLLVNGGYSVPGACTFYRNDLSAGGLMTEASAASGILGTEATWWAAAAADYDRDGWLDVVVTSREDELALYHNEGNGTFRDVALDAWLGMPKGDNKNPLWLDYDLDGYPDLYVASMGFPALFHNDAGARFTNVTAALLEPLAGAGAPVFAAAAADFDQDGWEDLYLGRWDQQDAILLNRGGGTWFDLVSTDVGLDMKVFPVSYENTMGLAVGDVNGDGFPEVLIGPGRPWETGEAIVYCHEGLPLSFRRCSEDVVAGHGEAFNHGVALADFDHDGDTDFVWSLGGHVEYDLANGTDSTDLAALYVRRPEVPPATAVVRLVGTVSNRDAIGARLEVVGSETRWYTIHSGQGFPSQSSLWLAVYVGDGGPANVHVVWPSGMESDATVAVGDRLEIVE